MSIFSIFKRKRAVVGDSVDVPVDNLNVEFQANDFLGKAAEAGHKAKDAVKAKRYDDAWKLFQEQKTLYLHHASKYEFTSLQTLALDSSVHEKMANILRMEGKHIEALINIVYWVLAGTHRPINRHHQKLRAYFNRCKFKNTTLEQAQLELAAHRGLPEYTVAKSIVSNWVSSS
tara:strand:+ start:4 stop:525 length:522 start_codon:yes stop_codon:yes gene_type:complete